jgi:hypothetical protein
MKLTDGGKLVILAWIAGVVVGINTFLGSVLLWILAVLLTAASVFYYRFMLRPVETGEY